MRLSSYLLCYTTNSNSIEVLHGLMKFEDLIYNCNFKERTAMYVKLNSFNAFNDCLFLNLHAMLYQALINSLCKKHSEIPYFIRNVWQFQCLAVAVELAVILVVFFGDRDWSDRGANKVGTCYYLIEGASPLIIFFLNCLKHF